MRVSLYSNLSSTHTSAASQSSSTATARETPCFAWFTRSLSGSNSICMLYGSYSKGACQPSGRATLKQHPLHPPTAKSPPLPPQKLLRHLHHILRQEPERLLQVLVRTRGSE